MGYYTAYELSWPGTEPAELITKRLTEISGYENRAEFLPYVCDGEEIKWYTHEEDMRQLSREFTDILFRLQGKGEDNEDIWVAYFLDGKMQKIKARITIDPFNPDELK